MTQGRTQNAPATSVWDDDHNDRLPSASAINPSSRTGKPSQKRVPKISALMSNAETMKKVKLEPTKMEETAQFPDDDAMFLGGEAWPEVKQEVASQSLGPPCQVRVTSFTSDSIGLIVEISMG